MFAALGAGLDYWLRLARNFVTDREEFWNMVVMEAAARAEYRAKLNEWRRVFRVWKRERPKLSASLDTWRAYIQAPQTPPPARHPAPATDPLIVEHEAQSRREIATVRAALATSHVAQGGQS